jgi:O-acetyl-ADP-ribose deacetylase (regulator of RNase III)
MKIEIGDIARPKCKNIMIPANTKGLMNRGVLSYLSQESIQGLQGIGPLLGEYLSKNPCKVGDVAVTGAGGLRRRGVRTIYHLMIKRLPADYVSIDTIRRTLEKCCSKVIKDKVRYVTLCGLGIEKGDLDVETVAMVTLSTLKQYESLVDFKILDKNENFINFLKILREKGT